MAKHSLGTVPPLLIGLLLLTSLSCGVAFAQSDYTFTDAQGNEITLPKGPVFSEQNPGPWKGLESIHMPEVSRKIRKEGLETIQILTVRISHSSGTENKIKAVYLLDKDDLIIGYKAFKPEDQELAFEPRINGNLNYVKIYADCADHGLWRKDVRLT